MKPNEPRALRVLVCEGCGDVVAVRAELAGGWRDAPCRECGGELQAEIELEEDERT